jgi:hypothetical protein
MARRASLVEAQCRLALFCALFPALVLARADEVPRGLRRQRAVRREEVVDRWQEQQQGQDRRVYREGRRSSQLNREMVKSARPKE